MIIDIIRTMHELLENRCVSTFFCCVSIVEKDLERKIGNSNLIQFLAENMTSGRMRLQTCTVLAILSGKLLKNCKAHCRHYIPWPLEMRKIEMIKKERINVK